MGGAVLRAPLDFVRLGVPADATVEQLTEIFAKYGEVDKVGGWVGGLGCGAAWGLG